MADPTEPDACAIAAQLRAARLDMLTGARASRVRIENRDVTFQSVDMAYLESQITRFEALCAAQQGQRPKRYAIRAGAPLARPGGAIAEWPQLPIEGEEET